MVAISLLRGINVGGNNPIRMDALKALHEELGCTDVQTYIQSGNVVFRTKLRDPAALGRKIEDAIEESHGFRPAVVVRTTAELREVVARNPFSGRQGIEPAKLVVSFLTVRPDAAAAERLRGIKPVPEELHLVDRELYIYFPEGQGRSKLVQALHRGFKIPGTARNWNTVTKLLDMAEQMEQ